MCGLHFFIIERDKIYKYISEVAENCAKLCAKGEYLRILNAYKILFDSLSKLFDF